MAAPLLERATAQAEVFDSEMAVQAGFLDRLATPENIMDRVMAEATRLASRGGVAFEQTRKHLRGASATYIRQTLEEDIAGLTLGGR